MSAPPIYNPALANNHTNPISLQSVPNPCDTKAWVTGRTPHKPRPMNTAVLAPRCVGLEYSGLRTMYAAPGWAVVTAAMKEERWRRCASDGVYFGGRIAHGGGGLVVQN